MVANFGSDGYCKVYWTSKHEVHVVNIKDVFWLFGINIFEKEKDM